jgi:4-carboxymuconolactone decarboxylase
MSTKSEQALSLFTRFVGEQAAAGYQAAVATSNAFGAEFFQTAMQNVFEGVWLRPGLDLRSRSLLTLGMVIAMGLPDEIRNHARGALAHGCTREELQEIALHCTAYVGFPAAAVALGAMAAAAAEHESPSQG